jgi:hypothetical protein
VLQSALRQRSRVNPVQALLPELRASLPCISCVQSILTLLWRGNGVGSGDGGAHVLPVPAMRESRLPGGKRNLRVVLRHQHALYLPASLVR